MRRLSHLHRVPLPRGGHAKMTCGAPPPVEGIPRRPRPRRAGLARAVVTALALSSAFALCAPAASAAELTHVKSVKFGGPRASTCDGKPCAVLDLTAKVAPGPPAAKRGRTLTEKRQVRVDATLMKQLRRLLGKADNQHLGALSKALLRGLSASAGAVREGSGEALIAVAERRGWSCTNIHKGVSIPKSKRRALQRIGCSFRVAAGFPITVTSGTRSPTDQARALDQKIRAGDTRLRVYRDRKSADELVQAWRAAKKAGKGPAATQAALRKAIDKQIARGVYISQHLRAGAVDIRSIGMSAKSKRALRSAVRSVPGASIIEERKPPHFHVELP